MEIDEREREKWIILLQGVKFFEGFDAEDVSQLLGAGKVRHYKFHEYVVKEREVDFSFFVILKGSVKLLKMAAMNKKKEVGKLGEGDCFGEMGLLLKTQRTASVLTAEECFIFKINVQDIEMMSLQTQAKLYKRFAEFLAERLKSTTENMVRPLY